MMAVKIGADLMQIAVASPDYLQRNGAPQTPWDLTAHRCINWRWPGQEDAAPMGAARSFRSVAITILLLWSML